MGSSSGPSDPIQDSRHLAYNREVREPKILLFYLFTPLRDPEAIHQWQRVLCESLNLRGRIIVSPHGINGTVGGSLADVKNYVKATKRYEPFKHIDFKWSEGTGEDFPRLSIKVRDELVAFGVPHEIEVNVDGVVNGGTPLTPREVNELVDRRGDDVIFFDGRNAFEATIGKFKNAVVPDVKTTHDFIGEIESGKYDDFKDRPVVTYCTGGIRCEILTVLMKNRGFSEVYQLDGGIVRYGETFGDDGLWEGPLFVFDERMTVEFSDHTKTISQCESCGNPTSRYVNCSNLSCRALILLCDPCASVHSADRCVPEHAGRR